MPERFDEFRRNWALVLLSSLGVGLSIPTFGVFGWGLFMAQMSDGFGWSLASVSFGVTVLTLTIAVTAPLSGFVIGRLGAYRTLLISMPLVAAVMACFTLNNGSLPRLYLLCLMIGLLGMGSSPILWTQLINQRFSTGRGLALGIASCGTAAFLLLVKPFAQAVIDAWGWRSGFLLIAAIPMLTVYPLALFLLKPGRGTSSAPGVSPQAGDTADFAGFSVAETVRRWPFWALLLASVLASSLGGLMPHLETILKTNGVAPAAIGVMASLIGAGLLMGRLVAGVLSDRTWPPAVFCALLAFGAAGSLGLDLTANTATTLASILALGLLAGGEFALLAYIAASYFGIRRYGVIFGLLWGVLISAGGIWSAVIGALVDRTGSYDASLRICAAALILGAGVVLSMGRAPAWTPRGAARSERHADVMAEIFKSMSCFAMGNGACSPYPREYSAYCGEEKPV